MCLQLIKTKKTFIEGLKEEDAYPADPEDGYGWENYLVNECADTFLKILGWNRVVRYHNIYGPVGTFDGGI